MELLAMSLYKSSEDNRTISQHISKLTYTLMIKDQDIPTLGTTLMYHQRHTLLLNLSMQTKYTIGSNLSGDKIVGKPIKEEYTTDHKSAGGLNQTLSTPTISHLSFKRPASLSPLQQLQ